MSGRAAPGTQMAGAAGLSLAWNRMGSTMFMPNTAIRSISRRERLQLLSLGLGSPSRSSKSEGWSEWQDLPRDLFIIDNASDFPVKGKRCVLSLCTP
jgi:hypothetical protein